MNDVLICEHITKSYDQPVLKDCTMHVPAQSIYGLIGKNGAGKTTLIRIVSGLQMADSGHIALFGNSKNLNTERRRMGAIVETPAIYSNMSAAENLKTQAILMEEEQVDIPKLLKLVGLPETGNKKAKNFSLGMKQRLGIAMVLVGRPDLIILDEPTNGLDSQGIIELRELILKLNSQYRITFVISSHILAELGKLATHYGFLKDGIIAKEMSAEQLDEQTEQFIEIEVEHYESLIRYLDQRKLRYSMVDEHCWRIWTDQTSGELSLDLAKHKIMIKKISNKGEDLESFYLRLMTGGIQ